MQNRLQLLREERGWSQQQLAKLLDVSNATIASIEKGRYEPSLTLASAMARLFGGRVEDIFPNSPRDPAMATEASRVTFVYTDIEGSTRLLGRLGPRYVEALETCRAVLRCAFHEQGGRVIDEVGDGSLYVFDEPAKALDAVTDAQRELAHTTWPDDEELTVRMGVHTGEAYIAGEFGERYVGLAVHEAARVMALAHGGQIFASEATALETGRDDRFMLRGSFELAGLDGPRTIYEVRGAE